MAAPVRTEPAPKHVSESRGRAVLPIRQVFIAVWSLPTSQPLIYSLSALSQHGGVQVTYEVRVKPIASVVTLSKSPWTIVHAVVAVERVDIEPVFNHNLWKLLHIERSSASSESVRR